MQLRLLEIFYKVVELKSFTKAADALYLTQPTVSSHIKSLEEILKVRLIDRLGREVVPTKAGRLLFDYVREIVRLKEEAKQALDQFAGSMKGNLEIGGSTIPGEYILPLMMSEFKKVYPDIVILLRIGDTQEVVKMVIEGKVELGVVGAKVEDKRLENREFMKDTLILVAAPSCPLEYIRKEDLKDTPLIFRERGSGSRAALERALEEHGLKDTELNIVAEMGSTEAVKQGVKSGLGLSVLSRISVEDELSNRELKEVKVKGLSIFRSFYTISHRLKARSPLCQTFLDFLYNQQ